MTQKHWKAIEERFREKFGKFQEPDEYTYNVGKTKDGFTQEDILSFFKAEFEATETPGECKHNSRDFIKVKGVYVIICKLCFANLGEFQSETPGERGKECAHDNKTICGNCLNTTLTSETFKGVEWESVEEKCKWCLRSHDKDMACRQYVNSLVQPESSWEELRKEYEEVQMVESSIEKAYPEAYRLARKFHELYEEQAPFFGYVTNPNSREFYPNSNNGRLMAYVCKNIIDDEVSEAEKRGYKLALDEAWNEIIKALKK